MSFSSGAQITGLLKTLKEKLAQRSSAVLSQFHSMDKDNSGQLTQDEFAKCLKEFGITLPAHSLAALIAAFDANGDGCVSIPEFSAFIEGRTETFDALKNAPSAGPQGGGAQQQGTRGGGGGFGGGGFGNSASYGSLSEMRNAARQEESHTRKASRDKPLTRTDIEFIGRMEQNIEDRRRVSFINELKKGSTIQALHA